MHQRGFLTPVLLILILIAILGIWRISLFQNNQVKTNPISETKTFKVTNGEIYDGDKLLFVNARAVEEARLGPDGHTTHFQVRETGDSPFTIKCANLDTEISNESNSRPDPPPLTAPWDYLRIGEFMTIGGCNEAYEGGYLKNSDFFAFIQIDGTKNGKLIIQNLTSKGQAEFPIEKSILGGFFSSEVNKTPDYWTEPVVGKDKSLFIYPAQDTQPVNGRLALSFGRFIVAVDTKENKYLGDFALVGREEGIEPVADSFFLNFSQDLPLVVVTDSWEGYGGTLALLDLSNDKLKVVKLSKYLQFDGPRFFDDEIPRVVWEKDGVNLTSYNTLDVAKENGIYTETIQDSFVDKDDKGEVEKVERKFNEILKSKGHKYVFCSFWQGSMYPGCYIPENIQTYRYLPGSGELERL